MNASPPNQSHNSTSMVVMKSDSVHSHPQSDVRAEINARLTRIIDERDSLSIEIKYAESTIRELHNQNRELHRLLSCAQDAVRSSDVRKPTQIHPRNLDLSETPVWIGGTWLSIAKSMPLLTESEAAWGKGKPQQALVLLTPILNDEGLKPSLRINAGLLYCTILRSHGDLEGALRHAEECLSIAHEAEQASLAGKAEFHKGLCCLHLDRFFDARWCFILASHTEAHADVIQEYLTITQQKLEELTVNDLKRKCSL